MKSGAGAGFTTSVTVVECTRLPLVPVMVNVKVPLGVVLLVVTETVEEPEPLTDAGLKVAFAPAGRPLMLKPTLPANPPDPATVAVYDVPAPAVTVCEAGVAVMEKSPTTGAVTVRVTVVVWLKAPEVPVIVTVEVPVAAVLLAVSVNTLVEVVGLVPKVAVTPAGRPEADRLTLPVNPPDGLTVTVLLPLPPWVTETLVGEAESEKSGAAPQFGNLKLAMCVFQLNEPVVFMYSVVNQKVQSSTGSTVMAL